LYIFGGYDGQNVLNDFYKFRLKPISVPPPALVNDFCRLINNDIFADIRFNVEGRHVYAHKAILAVRSEYMRAMLCGGMRESNTATTDVAASRSVSSQAGITSIDFPGVSYSTFLQVMEFLYTDTVRSVSLETSIRLLIASEQFMLDRLKALCEDRIRRDITVETVIGILVASHRHNAKELGELAFEFILKNLANPTVMTGLSDLKSEPDLLLEIIRRSSGSQGSGSMGQANPAGAFGAAAERNARR